MYFYLDFETYLIQPACSAPPPVCMVFAVDGGAPTLVHARDPMFELTLLLALEDPSVHFVAHNATFELQVLLAWRPEWVGKVFDSIRAGRWHCTMIRDKLIRIARGDSSGAFSLEACVAYHRLPITLDKTCPWRVRYGELYELDIDAWPAEAREYVLGDIAVRDLFLAQEKSAKYLGNEPQQVAAGLALALSSCWGFTTDHESAIRLAEEVAEELEKQKELCLEGGLLRRDIKKGQLVLTRDKKAAEARMVAACEAQGRPVPRGEVTEKMAAKGAVEGNIVLDEDACKASGDPVLLAYTYHGQAGTLMSKVRRLQHSPIQCRYNYLVDSGRTSCLQGDDPKPGEAWTSYGMQLQNPPRAPGVRECFVPRPGNAIVSIDFDSFELRTWSQACIDLLGYSDMAEVLRDPKRCPHVEMGAKIYNITTEEAYALKTKDPKRFKSMRSLSKCPNFGLVGGLGSATFVDFARATYGVIITEAQAKDIIWAWRQRWREAGPYLELIGEMVGRGGRGVVTQLRSGRVRGGLTFCAAANTMFQGLAADAAKGGIVELMFEMYERRSSAAYGCRMLAFIHDEVLVEVPLERLHEASYAARDAFVRGAQPFVPDIPLTASPAAMMRWSKEAGDPVHDANGRLICWEDRDKV